MTKILIFLKVSCGLVKLKLKYLTITNCVAFGQKKPETLVSLRIKSQLGARRWPHHVSTGAVLNINGIIRNGHEEMLTYILRRLEREGEQVLVC